MTADPATAAKLGWAHVLELRAAAKTGRWTLADVVERGPASDELVRKLEADGLMAWDGGARAVPGTGETYGTWETREAGAVAVTVAGYAFLRGVELGCQRVQAQAMTVAPSKKPKPKTRRFPTPLRL